ncbi:NACHT domain-containing protein [Streptomyces erythrochromogenes]|uniref:NACHT domain-containing protein n=1 Tax=Streptomyces erythrochromogenes TaxID=285574 RepID=UPI0033C19352
MEPVTIGIRLASAVIGPLVKKLFVAEGRGADLVDRPIRISGYVSFKGEKRTLTDADLQSLAAKLVEQALRTGERPIAPDERQAVIDALAQTLRSLGELTMSDLDAVRLGAADFARELRRVSDRPERELSKDATYFYERLVEAACLHILQFFTDRSTFVAHALVEQTRGIAELTAKVDELIRRDPLPGAQDAAFEQLYLPYVARRHAKLTIYGIDLGNSPTRWPLDAAYLSLEATSLPRHLRTRRGHLVLADEDPKPDAVSSAITSATIACHSAQSRLESTREPQTGHPQPHEDDRSVRDHLIPWLLAGTLAGEYKPDREHADGLLRKLLQTLMPQPADQALADSPRVLLRGEAGSGKSTLVQWLAVTAARQDPPPHMDYLHDRIPFVLPLRTLTRHGERLPAAANFLAASGCPLGTEQPAGWAHRVLTAGRGLVLIDGIDEIPDGERGQARQWLRELMDTYTGDNRWLVTSRPSAVGEDWLAEEDFTELTLAAMGPAEVATFIKRWHNAACDGGDADSDLPKYQTQLLTAVRTKTDLGRLATNPLMCGLICALHRDRRGYLPHGRRDLYEAALSMLLIRRDRERDMKVPDLREEPQLDLLQRLAYWLIKNGRTEMDRSRAEEIIARALPLVPEAAALGEAPVVFEYFLQRSGLLRAPVPDTVEFVHRTFQDFLGARAAVEEGDFGLLVRHAADDQWEDVIRMAVAHARPSERVAFFHSLLAFGDSAADHRTRARVYLLAAAALEHATTLDPATRKAVQERTATLIPPSNNEEARALAEVGPLILDLLPSPDELTDLEAFYVVVAASHVTSDAAMAYLARFVAHQAIGVRSQLVWAWSRFECAAYAEEVIAQLDPTSLLYTIRSDEQLHQLERLGLRPGRLDIRGTVSEESLAEYVSRHVLTELVLTNATVPNLDFLRHQTGLELLEINLCAELTDFTAIGPLPIRRLRIVSERADLDLRAVAHLTDLETFVLSGSAGTTWSARCLPTEAPLRELVISGHAGTDLGLDGLGAFTELRELLLNTASSPASEADWQEVGRLDSLIHLKLAASAFETLPRGLTLPGVTSLFVVGGGGERAVQAAIHRLAGVFDGLNECHFLGDFTAEGDLDLAPLASLTQLREVRFAVGPDRLRNVALLPSTVRLDTL